MHAYHYYFLFEVGSETLEQTAQPHSYAVVVVLVAIDDVHVEHKATPPPRGVLW